MQKYSGIDLHSTNNVLLVSDESDRVLYRKRLPNDMTPILAALEPHKQDLVAVVVESTYNWYWLVDGLRAAGYTVHLAHTGAMKQYEGLKHGDDETDAAKLTHQLRLGILPMGYIYPIEERGLRDLARRRAQLVRSRTMQVLAVENVQARQTGTRMSAAQVKRLDADSVEQLGLPEDVTLGVQANVAVIRVLSEQIAELERHLEERAQLRPEYSLLMTVPGIGRILATVIMLETGSIERFAGVGNFASYARCVDSVRLSNGKKKGQGNVRNGNKYLAWAFIEAATYAQRWCPEAKRFHDRKRTRTNPVVAKKALAHKLARASYHILKTRQPFDVKRCFA